MKIIITVIVVFLVGRGVCEGHTGEQTFHLVYLPSPDALDLDFSDGTLDDWWDVYGRPTIEVPSSCPADFSVSVWLTWNMEKSRIYAAVERLTPIDETDNSRDTWADLSFGLMVDGDHSGGEEIIDGVRTAQNYMATLDKGGTFSLRLLGENPRWITAEPFAEGGGAVVRDSARVRSFLEFYVTAFDTVDSDTESGVVSELERGKMIGLNFWVSSGGTENDTNILPSSFTLSGSRATWREPRQTRDWLLVPLPGYPLVSVFDKTDIAIKEAFKPISGFSLIQSEHGLGCNSAAQTPTATPHHSWGLIKSR